MGNYQEFHNQWPTSIQANQPHSRPAPTHLHRHCQIPTTCITVPLTVPLRIVESLRWSQQNWRQAKVSGCRVSQNYHAHGIGLKWLWCEHPLVHCHLSTHSFAEHIFPIFTRWIGSTFRQNKNHDQTRPQITLSPFTHRCHCSCDQQRQRTQTSIVQDRFPILHPFFQRLVNFFFFLSWLTNIARVVAIAASPARSSQSGSRRMVVSVHIVDRIWNMLIEHRLNVGRKSCSTLSSHKQPPLTPPTSTTDQAWRPQTASTAQSQSRSYLHPE